MTHRRPSEGRPSDGGYDARVLALKLVETCERSGADSRAVISALSVVLGMVLADVAEDHEVDIAIETIHQAIAAHDEDDHVGRLQ